MFHGTQRSIFDAFKSFSVHTSSMKTLKIIEMLCFIYYLVFGIKFSTTRNGEKRPRGQDTTLPTGN